MLEVGVESLVATAGDTIVLRTTVAGDFSTYTLRLVSSPVITDPPSGFDPALAEVPFSFKVDCDTDLDCAPVDDCLPVVRPAPHLSYPELVRRPRRLS